MTLLMTIIEVVLLSWFAVGFGLLQVTFRLYMMNKFVRDCGEKDSEGNRWCFLPTRIGQSLTFCVWTIAVFFAGLIILWLLKDGIASNDKYVLLTTFIFVLAEMIAAILTHSFPNEQLKKNDMQTVSTVFSVFMESVAISMLMYIFVVFIEAQRWDVSGSIFVLLVPLIAAISGIISIMFWNFKKEETPI